MISGKKFDKKYFTSGTYKKYKEILSQWVKPMAKRISQTLKEKPSARILDIGCSFGALLAELEKRYHFSVVGLEPSSYAIKKAHPLVRAKIKKGNILKLPFKKNSFDLVVCFDVVSYLTLGETIKAIKNLINVSRGYIFFSSIYRHSINASQKHNPDPLRLTALSEKEYSAIFFRDGAKFIKRFYGENGGDVLIFKKIQR